MLPNWLSSWCGNRDFCSKKSITWQLGHFFSKVFEHFVFVLTGLLAVFIPDVPADVKVQIQRENMLARWEQNSRDFTDISQIIKFKIFLPGRFSWRELRRRRRRGREREEKGEGITNNRSRTRSMGCR